MSDFNTIPLASLLDRLESGKRPKGGVKNIRDGVPSLGGEHLADNGGFKFKNIKYVSSEFARTMKRGQIKKGDILVVKDGATTAKASYVGNDFPFDEAVINEHLFLCRTKADVSSRYTFYFLWSEQGRRNILDDFRGAAQGGISTGFAKVVRVPVPGKAMQDKIVDKIEEELSKVTAAQSDIEAAINKNVAYRKSVLHHLFKNQKLITLGKLVDDIRYGTSKKCLNNPALTPVLRIPNVIDGRITLDDLKHASFTGQEMDKLALRVGDLLVIRSNGSPSIVGRCADVTDETVGYLFAGYIIRLRFDPTKHLAKFYKYVLSSPSLREQIEQKSKSTSGVNNINSDELKSLLVPDLDLAQQQQIVDELEAKLSEAAILDNVLNEALAYANSLRQTILQKAFAGDLV